MNQQDSSCEPDNFRRLFDEHSKALHHFAYYKSGDANQAEDVVQESYLRLWKNCAQVSMEKAKQFLFAVANNLMLDQFKHEKVKLKFQSTQRVHQNSQDPQFLMEVLEFKTNLETAIAALPEGQREVFLLNRIDKMKYREIAEHLGISQKAVEKRMHKALLSLREQFGKI